MKFRPLFSWILLLSLILTLTIQAVPLNGRGGNGEVIEATLNSNEQLKNVNGQVPVVVVDALSRRRNSKPSRFAGSWIANNQGSKPRSKTRKSHYNIKEISHDWLLLAPFFDN